MKKKIAAIAGLVIVMGLASCSSVLTPGIDEGTGTTLAQRCVDYRATLATLEALGETDKPVYAVLAAWVIANCPPVTTLPPAPEPTPSVEDDIIVGPVDPIMVE